MKYSRSEKQLLNKVAEASGFAASDLVFLIAQAQKARGEGLNPLTALYTLINDHVQARTHIAVNGQEVAFEIDAHTGVITLPTPLPLGQNAVTFWEER